MVLIMADTIMDTEHDSVKDAGHSSNDDASSMDTSSESDQTVSGNSLNVRKPQPSAAAQRRAQLVRIANETILLLPGLLITRPDAKPHGFLWGKDDSLPLDQDSCPKLPKTEVRVINCDTVDAALQMERKVSDNPVCVLNMANPVHAGGGFQDGSLAQEEALCYRTSLSFTLKPRFYPLPAKAAIYSPNVLVFRDSMANGHRLLDCTVPSQLPLISVISAAALYKPEVTSGRQQQTSGARYVKPTDRSLMAEKMRIILRVAIRNQHRKIVLGALGCGVFQNPPGEVSRLWEHVLQEPEFSGGWWEEVVFAILSPPGDRNFDAFHDALDGLVV